MFLKILNRFFVFLGVIFFIIILFAAYFWVTDPYNIKPMLRGEMNETENVSVENTNVDANPLLDESQEAIIRSIGIDPAALPSEITPAMEACFVEKLGQERVDEIVSGDSPTATEYMRTQSCL